MIKCYYRGDTRKNGQSAFFSAGSNAIDVLSFSIIASGNCSTIGKLSIGQVSGVDRGPLRSQWSILASFSKSIVTNNPYGHFSYFAFFLALCFHLLPWTVSTLEQ